ncbi:hypothetical protein NC652_030287 [Populus alba x Populus x berolinensis]|nr:hypothetical protein NC652_030287 [Populus alba x Populus x berolinensis]
MSSFYYSECRILKVLTLSESNQNLFTEKTLFSKLFPTYILIPRLQTSCLGLLLHHSTWTTISSSKTM